MVFLRKKYVKGKQYLYLVESKWDSKRNTPKQVIIAYLGNILNVTLNDIPSPYRTNSKIKTKLDFLKSNYFQPEKNFIQKNQDDLYGFLIDGDFKNSLKIYDSFTKSESISTFYYEILRPVMYRIGCDWEQNLVSVASEHVSSNIAHSLVNVITQNKAKRLHSNKILICTPEGEEHNLGCKIIESALSIKGFTVFNVSPSAPSKPIFEFIEEHNLDIILVSITLKDNIRPAQRLVKKISKFKVPIFVGGQALIDDKSHFDATIIQDISLTKLVKLVVDTIKKRNKH